MKEEVRLRILDEYKKRYEMLSDKLKRLNNLCESNDVKEYIDLIRYLMQVADSAEGMHYEEDMLFEEPFFSILPYELMEDASYHTFHECEHDSLLLIGTQKVGNIYYCLDCGTIFQTNDSHIMKDKNVCDLNANHESLTSIRHYYYNLLTEYSSKEAIDILQRKLSK